MRGKLGLDAVRNFAARIGARVKVESDDDLSRINKNRRGSKKSKDPTKPLKKVKKAKKPVEDACLAGLHFSERTGKCLTRGTCHGLTRREIIKATEADFHTQLETDNLDFGADESDGATSTQGVDAHLIAMAKSQRAPEQPAKKKPVEPWTPPMSPEDGDRYSKEQLEKTRKEAERLRKKLEDEFEDGESQARGGIDPFLARVSRALKGGAL